MTDRFHPAPNITTFLKQLPGGTHSSQLNPPSNMTSSGLKHDPSAGTVVLFMAYTVAFFIFLRFIIFIIELVMKPVRFVIDFLDHAAQPTPAYTSTNAETEIEHIKPIIAGDDKEDQESSTYDQKLEPFVWTFSRLNSLRGQEYNLTTNQQKLIKNWSDDDSENKSSIDILVNEVVDAIMAHRAGINKASHITEIMSSSEDVDTVLAPEISKASDETAKMVGKILEAMLFLAADGNHN